MFKFTEQKRTELEMSSPAELLCLVCKEVVRLAVMMPCCAGACCQDCAKNNINIYGSCPLCLAHSPQSL